MNQARRWQLWRAEWQATRQIMMGAQPYAWLRLLGRILAHPTPGWAGWVRSRALVEELYAERAAPDAGTCWDDPRTCDLLRSAMRHLPEHERTLAEGELAVLLFPDRRLHPLDMLRRHMLLVRLIGLVVAFVLVLADYEWSGIVVAGLGVGVSYGLAAARWISTYRAARRIWRAYARHGGTPFC